VEWRPVLTFYFLIPLLFFLVRVDTLGFGGRYICQAGVLPRVSYYGMGSERVMEIERLLSRFRGTRMLDNGTHSGFSLFSGIFTPNDRNSWSWSLDVVI
jgi:hypothetical protein